MRTCSSCGRETDGDFAFCPHCGAELAAGGAHPRAAEDGDGPLLRPHRLDRARRVARSGALARAARALLRADEGDRRAPRRQRGEVHRRCGDGRVRRAGRCTRTTRCARVRAAAEMRDALPELGLQGADRRHDRRGRDRDGGAAGDGRRGQRGRPAGAGGAAGRGADRAADARARSRRGRGRAGRAARAEGQGRAGSRLPAAARARRAGAAARGAVRRP